MGVSNVVIAPARKYRSNRRNIPKTYIIKKNKFVTGRIEDVQ